MEDNTRINFKSPFFLIEDEAMKFILEKGFIPETINCLKCLNFNAAYKKYKHKGGYTYYYYCNICNSKKNILGLTNFRNAKVPLNDILFIFYSFIIDIRNVPCYNLLNISLPTISRIRKVFSKCCRNILEERFEQIGGEGKCVQVDEKGFRRGVLVQNPTSYGDDVSTLWIIWGI